MSFTPFILGLSLGLGFCFWRQFQLNQQLKQMLDMLTDGSTKIPSLPLLYLVRREIDRINQQQQKLEKKIQDWQYLLEISPIGYLQVDKENQLLWCNQQAQELLKIERWQPRQVRLLLELVRSYELDQLIEETRSSQKSQVQEWIFYFTPYDLQKTNNKRGEGQTSFSLPLKASSLPLKDRQVGVFLENQQSLQELSQSRNRAFSDLTHELRTPLTSIRLVSEALQSRLQGSERRWVDQMLKEVNRLINLVQEWLELSHLEEKPDQHLNYQSIELKNLIFSVWQTLEPIAQEKKVNLIYSGSEELTLQADSSRLTQVFLNLFDNGIKHSPSQGVIYVEVELDNQSFPQNEAFIVINIIDRGSGFSESDLPYVFERLYRGDTSRTRQASKSHHSAALLTCQGSGLGLSIVQQIVQAHGGSIQAKNHPETGGGWLQLKLPIV